MADQTSTITTPTFLKRLLLEFCEDKIELICIKEEFQETIPNNHIGNNVEDSPVNDLDLTGTPLLVQLEDDTVDITLIVDRQRNWSKDEEYYHPLPLNQARKLLNFKLQQSLLNVPRYCLCDGKNDRHIIVLGAKQTNTSIINTVAYILPPKLADNNLFSEDFIRKLQFTEISKAEVNYSIIKRYLLYGPKNLHESTCCGDGQIKIEIFAKHLDLNKLFLNLSLNMDLKVVVGDKKSDLFGSWNDFCILYRLFSSKTDGDLSENIQIHNEDLHNDADILENLNNTLKKLDFYNRHLNIWSQLWEILKYCKNLIVLQECVQILLIEFVNNPSMKCILEEDTTIVRILSILLERKFQIPTKQQCFELLLEIGYEKLKRDYCLILDKYPKINHKSVLQQLSKLQVQDSGEKFILINFKIFKMKLCQLYHMHMIAESLLFYQKTLKLSTSFDNFIDFINKKLNKIVDFEKIQLTSHIFECSFNLNSIDLNIVETLLPAEVYIRIGAKSQYSENATMYYYSEFPPIPNIDYNSIGLLHTDREHKDKKYYYVTKVDRTLYAIPAFINMKCK